jgi:hypothetical protein
MIFMSMQGYIWSYNESSYFLVICFSKFLHLPLFELIKNEAALKSTIVDELVDTIHR